MFDEREPSEPELTPDLKALEGRLARLAPAGARVDRDQLMYEAGRAAASEPSPCPSLRGRGNVWMWRGASGLMTAASLMLATMLVWQRQSFELALQELKQPVIAAQIAGEQQPAALPSPVAPDVSTAEWLALRQPAGAYLGVRYTALTRGVDAIDSETHDGNARGTLRELERSQRDIMNDFLPSAKQSRSRS